MWTTVWSIVLQQGCRQAQLWPQASHNDTWWWYNAWLAPMTACLNNSLSFTRSIIIRGRFDLLPFAVTPHISTFTNGDLQPRMVLRSLDPGQHSIFAPDHSPCPPPCTRWSTSDVNPHYILTCVWFRYESHLVRWRLQLYSQAIIIRSKHLYCVVVFKKEQNRNRKTHCVCKTPGRFCVLAGSEFIIYFALCV